MSHAKLTHDLLLLYGGDSDNESSNLSDNSDSDYDGVKGGGDKRFFDDIIGGYLSFDSDYNSGSDYDDSANPGSVTSTVTNISDLVDIFSDNEEYDTMTQTMGGYLVIKKDIDDNRDTYEQSELSEKTMYRGSQEDGGIFSDFDAMDSDLSESINTELDKLESGGIIESDTDTDINDNSGIFSDDESDFDHGVVENDKTDFDIYQDEVEGGERKIRKVQKLKLLDFDDEIKKYVKNLPTVPK